MEDCNRCKCANNGIGWFCTRKACPPIPTPAETRDKRDADEETTVVPLNTPGYTCEPGSRFKHECNSCKCASSGTLAACTKKRCLPEERTKRDVEENKIAVNEPGFKCEPNQPFMDDCNSCFCDASGILARCTLMACDPNERTKRDVKDQEIDCEPNQEFFVNSSLCFCDETGHGAFCSADPAQEHPRRDGEEKKKFCEADQDFVSGSWNCTCDETGNAAFCTKGSEHDLPREKRSPESNPDKCQPGAKWFDGCNNCWCTCK